MLASLLQWTNRVALPSDKFDQCNFVDSIAHVTLRELYALVHPPQTTSTILSVQPSSSYVAYIAPYTLIHALPPNLGQPPPLLQSNLYPLLPTNISYHLDVRNPQIQTFKIGESSTNSKPNVQASSSFLRIATCSCNVHL